MLRPLVLLYALCIPMACAIPRPRALALVLGSMAKDAAAWIYYESNGEATMTHYTMKRNYIAACGCTGTSTHYPTAALSERAYGSLTSYGLSCGRCFNLTLQNTYIPNPPFFPTETKSIVIKVTDHCPLGGDWCNATETTANKGGRFLNFDLVWPSKAIPNDFYPHNESFYGFKDFGVWNISYQSVSCEYWAGWSKPAALGSVPSLVNGACCPANPSGNPNDTCPSFSDNPTLLPPNTASTSSAWLTQPANIPKFLAALALAVVSTL